MADSMTTDPELVQGGSFELPGAGRVDVEQDRIVLAGENELVVVTPDGRHRTTIDRDVDEIAVGRNIYLRSGSELAAFTETGVELWTREFETIDGIAATGGNIAVLRDGTRIEIIDGTTSSRRTLQELPHPNLQAEGVFAAETGFLVASWSYLTRIDLSGAVAYDRNLVAQFASVGTLGYQAVAALKSDTLRSIDRTGTEQWRRETTATKLTASGTTPLLAVGEEHPYILHDDGAMEPLDIPVGTAVAATDALGVICVVGVDETVREFYPAETASTTARLDASVRTDAITPDAPLEIALTNDGNSPVTANVEIRADGATVTDPHHEVTIGGSDPTLLETSVRELEADEAVTVSVFVDGEQLTSEERPVATPSDTSAVEIDGSPIEFEDGKLWIELRVRNDGDRRIDALSIPAADRQLGSVDRRSVARFEVPVPREITAQSFDVVGQSPEGPIRMAVSVETGSDPIEITLTNGASPEPYVEARFENRSEIPLCDELVVSVSTLPSELARETTIPGRSAETFVVFLPTPPDGREVTVEASATGIATRNKERFPGGESPETDPQSSHATSARRETESDGTAPIGASSPAHASAETGERATLEIDRSIADTVAVDRMVEEQLTITNTSETPISGATVTVGDRTIQVPELSGGETIDYERGHVFRTSGNRRLPEGTLRYCDTEIDIPAAALQVTESPLRVEAVVRKGDRQPELTVAVENGGSSEIDVTHAALASPSAEERIEWRERDLGDPISSGERSEVVLPVSERIIQWDNDVFIFGFRTERMDESVLTLAEIRSGGPTLEPTIIGGPVIQDTYSTLSVRFENAGQTPISDLHLEADCPHLDEFYAPSSFETVSAGSNVRHDIDLVPPDATRMSIELSASWTADGEPVDRSWTIAGPVAERERAWDETSLADWTITAEDTSEETERGEWITTAYIRETEHPE